MHFNIYLDDQTGQRLTEAAQQAGENRNAVIRRAVQEWLARRSQPGWPQAVLGHNGFPNVPPFEAERKQLAPALDDPLA
ncbi:MAG: ribbon-helix-helix domain-containing protein [Hydrogenophaga sp.]|nr:ribbon-helix-helix domain-containing protein [Hydrogenophaga sp.]